MNSKNIRVREFKEKLMFWGDTYEFNTCSVAIGYVEVNIPVYKQHSNLRDLRYVECPFTAIATRSTLTQSSNT